METIQRCLIDWCGFTFLDSSMKDLPLECFNLLRSWTGENISMEKGGRKNFYENTFDVFAYRGSEAILIAHVSHGGESQKGRANVQINGTGCSTIRDWQPVVEFLDSLDDSRLTRVDIACDFLKGEISVDEFQEFYEQGHFNKNGRPPSHNVHGCWFKIEQGTGRTLEVGKRKNGMMFRAYEKGRQLGNPDSPWVRAECEFHNVDRELLSEMLISPDQYFAGAYPCLEAIVYYGATRIMTEKKSGETSLEKLLKHLHDSYGKAIHVATESIYFEKQDELIEKLRQLGVPKRLKRAALQMLPEDFSPRPLATG